jgi:RNA polymerase sigma-70 factor, ECF subfamily
MGQWPGMTEEPFDNLMKRLRQGDDQAAAIVHGRFVHRLVALASSQFDSVLRVNADHEDVIQSVFKSFFNRFQAGAFDLGDWEALWALLATITIRKCGRKRDSLNTQKRSAGINGTRPLFDSSVSDREPTPEEAAEMTETLTLWLTNLDAAQRGVIELGLQGYSDAAIASKLKRSERTVRRVRWIAEERLLAEIRDEGPGCA